MRVLVVDDNDVIRAMLRMLLEKLGHAVVAEAGSGEAAVAAFSAARPDLVTLDISLPDFDGLEVLRRILARDPLAKVVVITGNNSAALEKDARAGGALKVLQKPFDFAAIAKLLDGLGGGGNR